MAPLKEEPVIRVGLIHNREVIEFSIEEPFKLVSDTGESLMIHPISRQKWSISLDEKGNIRLGNSENGTHKDFAGSKWVQVVPQNPEETILTLHNVTIGIQFHWQRDEDQDFSYVMEFRKTGEKTLTAINQLPVEAYLQCVISSEMSGTSPLSLLKAHTVIARSWLIAQMKKPPHRDFLVCADDHCQRYQGLRRLTKAAVQAARETRGEVLTYQEEVCDTRYYKICGGVSEDFVNCWPPEDVPYCTAVLDETEAENKTLPDLTVEANVREWVMSRPESFCNATPEELAPVLNEYDKEIPDLYRWVVTYTNEELAKLVETKSGKKIGKIKKLIPLRRGPSGRIIEMDIVGTESTLHIDDQLELRRHLSESHLYSSCFVVDTEGGTADIPAKFILHGGGWGHGVGLCQIGAAMMAIKGYDYQQILFHYYKGSSLTPWWK
jgi:SpoIID/LytB domain protein